MNKKTIDKIDIFTLDFTYTDLIKDIFKLTNLDNFISFINNDISEDKFSINLLNRLLEYSWFVFIDEIVINKDKYVNFYKMILEKYYDKRVKLDVLENIINDNIKKYLIQKNNINYHKIILESI